MHLGQEDLAVALALGDEGSVLSVDLDDSLIVVGVVASDQSRQDNLGVGGGLPEKINKLLHALSGRIDLKVLYCVVGAEVDEVEVGLVLGDIGLGVLVVDLANAKTWETLVLVVGHGAAGLATDVGEGVSGISQGAMEESSVTVAQG